MAGHVISQHGPRRKRGRRSLLLRRLGVLIVTIAALAASVWLAPLIYRPPPSPASPQAGDPQPPPVMPRPSAGETLQVDAEPAAAPAERPRPHRARRGVPLDARPPAPGEDYEVLSASELDAISQQRE